MKDYCDLTILLDRSGSMQGIRNDMLGALNTFVDDQKKVGGEAVLSLVQFDDRYEVKTTAKPLKDVAKFTQDDFVPRGNTALVGALGRVIDETGERLAALPESERPDKVVVVVITDGEENFSGAVEWAKRYSRDGVMRSVERQRDTYKWQFVYLGANQDAIKVAASYGIPAHAALNYTADSAGVQSSNAVLSKNLRSYRSAGPAASLSVNS